MELLNVKERAEKKFGNKYFREAYESEVGAYNNKIDARNCLFPEEQEKCD